MRQLWKDTFHDSDEYVDMIFDHYYDPRLCLHYAESGRLISSAFMIPYDTVSGLRLGYVCGLATVPERRGEGIMRRLLQQTEVHAREEGFAGTFLIPADEGLREYYRRQGYVDTESVTKFRINKIDVSGLKTSISHATSIMANDRIISEAMSWERNRGGGNVVHSHLQWKDVIDDIIRDGGEIIGDENSAVIYRKENGEVGRLFGSDCDLFALLRGLSAQNGEDIIYRCTDACEAESLRKSGLHIIAERTSLYGMVKPAIPQLTLRLMLD